jgi:hypothetical protein
MFSLGMGQGVFIHTFGDYGIVDIGNSHDTAGNRYGIADKAPRVSVA